MGTKTTKRRKTANQIFLRLVGLHPDTNRDSMQMVQADLKQDRVLLRNATNFLRY